MDEIEVPKDVVPMIPSYVKETILGDKRGAKRQYRYGNLHIREYDDRYTLHLDRVDPRKDPLGHLIHDAPEVLIGLASGLLTAYKIGKRQNLASSILASSIIGYLTYRMARYAKER